MCRRLGLTCVYKQILSNFSLSFNSGLGLLVSTAFNFMFVVVYERHFYDERPSLIEWGKEVIKEKVSEPDFLTMFIYL